ncbi:UPF0413 protein YjbH [Emticicia aquatilis]|uniref:UPF0413 protein YjbH n=2 Tax=Emticicia aquatilis TaxID=1537369 RepID=A0A916Z0H0_9BACT|nr:UPF0413 protein YjbH [Emticicia aquatilis]
MSNENPLLCDIESGICGVESSDSNSTVLNIEAKAEPIKIVYFTDPICSSCWGIEPQLRRLKLEYGSDVEVEYHMGGLLKDWSYNSGGISKPSDVAHHWDEVSHHYEMPIDGDVWLEDPLSSSYPPSIAFKAAEIQDKQKAILFLRKIREMVFLEKKNITKWEYLEKAANEVGLNVQQLKQDFDGEAKELFKKDLILAREMGVRGFPSLFFSDTSKNVLFMYGARPYNEFITKLTALTPNIQPQVFKSDWKSLFQKYNTLTAKEFAVLRNQTFTNAEEVLKQLTKDNLLEVFQTKNGAIWKIK